VGGCRLRYFLLGRRDCMRKTQTQRMLERQVKELSLSLRSARIWDRSMDLRDVVGPVLVSMAKYMGMMRGNADAAQRESDEILIEAAHGLSQQQQRGRYRPGEVSPGGCQTGRPRLCPIFRTSRCS